MAQSSQSSSGGSISFWFFGSLAVTKFEHRTILWSHLPPIVKPGGCNVGMAEQLLDLGQVSAVEEGIGSSGYSQSVR